MTGYNVLRYGFFYLLALLTSTIFAFAQAEPAARLLFRNNTDATIRIDTITVSGEEAVHPKVVKSRSELAFNVPAGRRAFELIAFRANPVRIHSVNLRVPKGETVQFNITPHIMGLYLLEDVGSLASIAAIPSAPLVDTAFHPQLSDIADHCKTSTNSIDGVVIWVKGRTPAAQYYRDIGTHLCAVDGSNAFYKGEIYKHFICRNKWQDCVRYSDGDALLVPEIRTSNTIDTALRLALLQDAHADFTRTQTLEWLRAGRPASRLTRYIIFQNLKPEKQCPKGYRLHYQGQCINIADELEDDPEKGVRMVEPEVVE